MHLLRLALMLTGVAVLTVGGLVSTAAESVAESVQVPFRLLHEGRGGPLEVEAWVAVAQNTRELDAIWLRLHDPGEQQTTDFDQEFVVGTSRIAPCHGPPRPQGVSWQEGTLVLRVSDEPIPGGCPTGRLRVEWVAAIERDALPGSITTAVFIDNHGDELARIDVSIAGPPAPEPEPTLPDTGLPIGALLILALASLVAGQRLTMRTSSRTRSSP